MSALHPKADIGQAPLISTAGCDCHQFFIGHLVHWLSAPVHFDRPLGLAPAAIEQRDSSRHPSSSRRSILIHDPSKRSDGLCRMRARQSSNICKRLSHLITSGFDCWYGYLIWRIERRGLRAIASAGRGPSRTNRIRSSRRVWGGAARRIAGSHKKIGRRRWALLRVARNRNAGR